MTASSLLILLLVVLFAFLLVFWVRERRYLKKKTSETMSENAWGDIEAERKAELRKHRLFREAMEKAKDLVP